MSHIKKDQCPSCGGNLIDDSEKQLYRCSSCGSSYDYDYFREEQLHEMGETYLSRGEVKAAVDAYRLILKKTPHDFLALRGLMLAAAYLKDMDGYSRIGEARHFSYDSDLAGEVLDAASEEDKEYFSECEKIYVKKEKQIDLKREIESLRRKRESIKAKISFTDNTRYEYYFETKHGQHSPNTIFILIWCFAGYFGMSGIAGASGVDEVAGAAALAIIGVLFLLIGFCINFFLVYPRIKAIKMIDAEVKELNAESDRTAEKIKALEAEAEELLDDIRKAIRDFVKKDSLMTKDSVKEQVPEFGKIKKHQCPSCGGSLRIDSDKQMYHCTFCGSTYDYEYFREDRIHEAGETYLSRGEFMATTEAYEFMLKKDPHDFLALRGLMLAAAHMTDMSELDQDNKEFAYDSETVSRVIESASEEDKKYFTEFAKIYAEKKSLADCSKEIEDIRKEKNKINSLITDNITGGEGNYDKKGIRTKGELIISYIAMWVLTAFFMLMTFWGIKDLIDAYASNSGFSDTGIGFLVFNGVVSLVLVVSNHLGMVSSLRRLNKIQNANAALYDEVRKMDDKIRELENESSKLTGDIRRFVHEFVRKDRLIMQDNKSK